jgi:tetratricopeptide (TPR) repeat protein
MRGFSEQEQRVLSINPHFGRFYSVVAESAEWEHRYPDVVSLQKRALKLDPDDATAHANLGLGLLRMGDEPAGLLELHEAWARDRFNVQVFNTLNLYEVSIRGDYTEFAAEGFRIRLHKTERAVLAPYLVPLLRRAYTQLHERWDFAPVGPLRVELYADRAQFSVRTTGLPNAGIQGVSFGKVVTGLSPRGGPFNWGQIVWHELSHVFHLQLSKNHVPRWFTEGLAEYETALERPEWKREDDPVLWQALRAGRLPPLAAMNRAFTQARSSEELMVAYFFAYRAVQYIVERFGFPSVRKLLVSFGEGQKLETAIVRVLGVDVRQLDREFRSALCERLAKYQREFAPDTTTYADAQAAAVLAARAPRDPDLWAALSLAELNAGHMEAAVHAADSSLKIAPSHRLAHFARARVALAQGDVSTAERSLLGIVESGADGYSLRMLLARGAFERGSIQLALQHAQAAVRFDADRPDAHKLLLELAGKLNDDTLALQALRALAELDQHDSALHIAYLAVLVRNKAWDDVIHEGETALFVAPEEPSVHFNLGQGYVEREAYARGLVELDRALALGYPKPGNVRLVRAKALLGLGRRAAALRELKQARALDEGLEQLSRALAE